MKWVVDCGPHRQDIESLLVHLEERGGPDGDAEGVDDEG